MIFTDRFTDMYIFFLNKLHQKKIRKQSLKLKQVENENFKGHLGSTGCLRDLSIPAKKFSLWRKK